MKTFPFPFYPFEKEEMLIYLNNKAKEGYLLSKVNFIDQSAEFTKTDLKNIVYDLTLHKDSGAIFDKYNHDIQEYLDSCKLSGWHHICSKDGVRFFYGEANTFPLSDPVTDNLSEQDKKKEFLAYLKHTSLSPLLFSAILIMIYSSFSNNEPISYFQIYIVIDTLCYATLYLLLRYSNNITFRLKGIDIMTVMILLSVFSLKFHLLYVSIILSILCILTFIYLFKSKSLFISCNTNFINTINIILLILIVIL